MPHFENPKNTSQKSPSVSPSGTVFARIFHLAAPIIGVNVLNVLALTIDTAMCGHLENGADALTALSFATQIIFMLMVAMLGLSVGSVATVARAFGEKNQTRVNHVLQQAFWLTLGISAAVAIFGNIGASSLLRLLGAQDSAINLALAYLRPLLWGTIFNYMVILLAAVLRGVGNTRIAFLIALLTNGLNIIINSLLIHGTLGFPALGVQGAAFGTVISQAAGTLSYIILIKKDIIHGVRLSLKPPKVDREIAKTLLKIGTPAAFDMVVLNAALVSMVSMLGRIDPLAVAAHGIGLRIQGLAFLPGFSLAQAIGALVGQALGAKDEKQADAVVRAGKWMTSGLMTTIAILLFVFAGPIVSIFDVAPGSDLDRYAQMWMRILGTGMPFVGYYFAIFGILQGAGATKDSLRINAFTTLLMQIPLSAFFAFALDWGAFGVWLAFPLSYLPKSALGWHKVRQGNWKKSLSR